MAALIVYGFAFLGSRGLWDPDEGRYSAVALQMLRSGDWIHPHLHPEHPHYTKPPLTYWAIAAAVRVLGHSEWAVRTPGALAFLLTLGLIYCLGRYYVPERRWLPVLVYATTLLPYMAAGIVTTDTLLVAWEVLAASAFVADLAQPRRRFQLLLWTGFGLAFLTKGPPGLLPLLAMVTFALARRDWRVLRRLFSGAGLALFALIGLGWYLAVVLSAPQLWHYFIHYELIDRIASATHHRHGEWYGAFLVYVPTFLLGALPWSLLWWGRLGRLRPKRLAGTRLSSLAPAQQFLLLWFSVPLLVFVLSRSRLPFYVLPLFVPLSLLTAQTLPNWVMCRRRAAGGALAAVVVALLAGRWYGSVIDHKADARALAAAIQRQVQGGVDELVFVDNEPLYGLSFYFHAPVEHVCLHEDCDQPGLAQDEKLAAELKHDQGRQLFLARAELAPEVLRQARAQGRSARNLGLVRGMNLLEITGSVPTHDKSAQ